jgi:hypothetical protein
MMERGLTREEILQKYPPKIEVAYPRRERAREGILLSEFMVSRDETGRILFAMGAEGFYKSLENTGESSESEQPAAGSRVYTTTEKIKEFERLRSAKPRTDNGLVQERVRRRTRHPQDAANW